MFRHKRMWWNTYGRGSWVINTTETTVSIAEVVGGDAASALTSHKSYWEKYFHWLFRNGDKRLLAISRQQFLFSMQTALSHNRDSAHFEKSPWANFETEKKQHIGCKTFKRSLRSRWRHIQRISDYVWRYNENNQKLRRTQSRNNKSFPRNRKCRIATLIFGSRRTRRQRGAKCDTPSLLVHITACCGRLRSCG